MEVKKLKIKVRKQHGSQSNEKLVLSDLAATLKDSTNTLPHSSTTIRSLKVKKFSKENKKLPQQKICQIKNSNTQINLKNQRTNSNSSSQQRTYIPKIKGSQEAKRVWKIKQKKEEPQVIETDLVPQQEMQEKFRKTMTYIEKKDLETDFSLKNGPPEFQVFSSEKRIQKKQKVDSDDDLLCEENIEAFKSPEHKEKVKEFSTFGVKDSANLQTHIGAENVNVNARVSIFFEPKEAAANVPYQSSQKSSHNISGGSNEQQQMVNIPEEEYSLNVVRQISKASSTNDRGLHVQITKKLDELNLKSPRAAPLPNWMGLVEDALGIEDLDDDEEPFIPKSSGVGGQKGTQGLEKQMDYLQLDEKPVIQVKLLSEHERLTDLGESPSRPVGNRIFKERYDPHEPHSAQIQQPVSGNLLNFKDDSQSPDGSPTSLVKIEAIPESQELALLDGIDDSLECDEDKINKPDFQEDECDLVDDDFFQNLMKKPANNVSDTSDQNQKDFSRFLHNQDEIPYSPIIPPPKLTLNQKICQEITLGYFPLLKQKFEIFQQMLKKDELYRASLFKKAPLFERQTELTSDMRLMLLDWICQVSSDYCLKRETFHLSVQYIDHYIENCAQHIPTKDFQLIGVTCLHMAAKFEEIYPPHIRAFAESTNDSVTVDQIVAQEYKVCAVLRWNFNQFQTPYIWATWFMNRWDEYVDESLSYLKQQFQLKFLEGSRESHQKFHTFMQFVDILTMSYESKSYSHRALVACVMYLIIGGKDIMCAFQFEYREMYSAFQEQFPIQKMQGSPRLPEGILFYNQIIQPFFINEFGYYLHDLIDPMKFVLKFFILDITEFGMLPSTLVQQCKFTMQQQQDIAIEKIVSIKEQGYYPSIKLSVEKHNFEQYTDSQVFANVNEFFTYQTYNPQMLDTLKYLTQTHCDESSGEIALQNLQNNSEYQRQLDDSQFQGQPNVISLSESPV